MACCQGFLACNAHILSVKSHWAAPIRRARFPSATPRGCPLAPSLWRSTMKLFIYNWIQAKRTRRLRDTRLFLEPGGSADLRGGGLRRRRMAREKPWREAAHGTGSGPVRLGARSGRTPALRARLFRAAGWPWVRMDVSGCGKRAIVFLSPLSETESGQPEGWPPRLLGVQTGISRRARRRSLPASPWRERRERCR